MLDQDTLHVFNWPIITLDLYIINQSTVTVYNQPIRALLSSNGSTGALSMSFEDQSEHCYGLELMNQRAVTIYDWQIRALLNT